MSLETFVYEAGSNVFVEGWWYWRPRTRSHHLAVESKALQKLSRAEFTQSRGPVRPQDASKQVPQPESNRWALLQWSSVLEEQPCTPVCRHQPHIFAGIVAVRPVLAPPTADHDQSRWRARPE